MGLTNVMSNALSGMRVTQSGLDVVSQNISNADAIGYVRRRVNVVEQVAGGDSAGARINGIDRMLDRVIQRQLWTETAGAGYTKARAGQLSALDQIYGPPDGSSALGAVFGRFTQSLQALKGDPSSYTLRSNVLTMAQEMAARLQDMAGGVQDLRSQAEAGISAGVTRVNELLVELQNVNNKILDAGQFDTAPALRDQRDRVVTDLAQYIDIRTTESQTGSLNVFTTSGFTLFNGTTATRLAFDPAASVGADQLWNANDALRGVGTIRGFDQFGAGFDMIANGAIRSGELAALIEMRDETLVTAQNQLDEMAGAMASALSDRQIAGSAVTVGAATGFDVDTAALLAGNPITLDYTDQVTGFRGRFTFVRADSAAGVANVAAAGLSAADNQVIGINFSGGMGSVAAQIQAALGGGFTVSNAGSVLRIVDDGAANTRDVNALSAHATVTGFSTPAPNGGPELPFFVDTGVTGGLYTGSFEGRAQMRGFSQRIALNPQLVQDRSRLVVFETAPATPQGDSTRPDFLYERLTSTTRHFSPQTGLGGTSAAFRSTIVNFAQRVVEQQGSVVEAGLRLNEGQQIALKSVQSRFAEKAAVSVDQEMASLIELQNAYAANARIISAVKEMMDLLIRI